MKGKKKFKFQPKLAFLFAIIAGTFLGSVSIFSNEVDGVLFSLTGNTEVPDVDCWGKTTSSLDGLLLEKSSFLSGHPTFNLITIGDETPTTADIIDYEGFLRCTFPTGNSENTSLPLVIAKGSSFKVSVYAYEKNVDEKQLVFTETKTVNQDVILLWNTESKFISFEVPLKNILEGLKAGEYEATAELRLEGTAIMNYQGFTDQHQAINWQFKFEQDDVRNWIDFPINKAPGATVSVGGSSSGSDSRQVFDSPDTKNINDHSNDDLTEFIECAKIMNTECLFNEKFNGYWMVIGMVGIVGVFMERSRQ